MFPNFNIPDKKMYGLIYSTATKGQFLGIEIKTGKLLMDHVFLAKISIQYFVEHFNLDKNIYQVVIVDIHELDDAVNQKPNAKSYSKLLKERIAHLQIPSYFTSNLNLTSLLVASNCIVPIDKTVLVVSAFPNEIRNDELKFTPAGFEFIRSDKIELNEHTKIINLHDQILQSSTPKKIVLWDQCPKIPLLKILKSKKLTVLKHPARIYHESNFLDICAWFFDRSNVKSHILPISNRNGEFSVSYGGQPQTILSYDHLEKLPYSAVITFPRTIADCFFIHDKDGTKTTSKQVFHRGKCHQLKLSYLITVENFEEVSISAAICSPIKFLPEKLKGHPDLKLPVIGFWDNSSVILCHDDERDEYQFLKSWGGLYGDEMFISFDKEIPEYGRKAWKKLEGNSSSVVYDLIAIMSKPIEKIKNENQKWGFKIKKSEPGYPILIDFENFDSTRKAQTPVFLMAMLLKKHVKHIKKRMGKRPSKIGFHFFDKFCADEMQRIADGMKDACELLKIEFIRII